MQCPYCAYIEAHAAQECPRCHNACPVAVCEELGHLRYTREFVDYWWANGVVPGRVARHLLGVADEAAARLQQHIRDWTMMGDHVAQATPQSAAPLHTTVSALATVAAGTPSRAPAMPHNPSVPAGQDPAPVIALPAPASATVPLGARRPARQVAPPLPQARPLAMPPSILAAHRGSPPPPPRPANPPRPAFSWKQVGTYLLSERTLNGLLALGAFLILAAAAVISTLNPTGLPSFSHLAAMIVTTMAFYGAGAFVQQLLKLTITGDALLAIGAAFVPLDVWTLGHDIMEWSPGTIWLAASLLCLPLYIASYIWLHDRAFALLSAIAGGSLLAAACVQTGITPVWTAVGLLGLALIYLALAPRLRLAWPHLSWALFWIAQATAPALLGALTALRFGYDANLSLPIAWQQTLGAQSGASLDYAVGASWWLCAAFYALASLLYGRRGFSYAALWATPCAVLFTLTKAPFDAAWYGIFLAVLAALYLLCRRALPRTPSAAPALLTAPAMQTGATLTVIAALWPALIPGGVFTSVAAISTLALVACTYGAAAFPLRLRACAAIGVALVPITYALLLVRLGLGIEAQILAWALLATALVACGERAATRSGEQRRPMRETVLGLGAWRSRFASPLIAAGYATCLPAAALGAARYATAGLGTVGILGLLLVVALAALSTVSRRSGVLLYSATWLLPIPVLAIAAALAVRIDSGALYGHMLGGAATALTLIALGLLYLAPAYLMDRHGSRYARPIYHVANVLPALGLGLALATLDARVILAGSLLVALQHAVSASVSRRSIFSAPLAICLAIAYLSGLWLLSPAPAHLGQALLPGVALFLVAGEILHRLDARALLRETARPARALHAWATPFTVAGHLFAASAFVASALAGAALAAATFGALAALYAALAAMRRRPGPLYPAVGCALVAYATLIQVLAPDISLSGLLLCLAGPVWALVWLADSISRGQATGSAPHIWRMAGRAGANVWARPLVLWAALAVMSWAAWILRHAIVAGALGRQPAYDGAGLATALAYAALLAVFSLRWRSRALVWGTLACLTAASTVAPSSGVPAAYLPVIWTIVALPVCMLGISLRRLPGWAAALWAQPLLWSVDAVLAPALAMATLRLGTDPGALQPTAATMAVAGLTLLLQGIGSRLPAPRYLGLALLYGGYACELQARGVAEPQAYALPGGIALLALAYLHWRRGAAGQKLGLEIGALALLLGTSLLQALSAWDVSAGRLDYATFLLLEGVLVLGIGAVLRWKRTFFAAAAAIVAATGALLADPLQSLNTWYLMAIIGIAMITLVVLLEQRRQQIPLWIDEVRLHLEAWS